MRAQLSMDLPAGRYAAIDIGTVTCRLLIADISDTAELTEVCARRAFTNLGAGVDATGLLQQDSIERVLETVRAYLQLIRKFSTEEAPVRKLKVIATSASRDARNGDALVEALKDIGAFPSIVEGSVEAGLSFMGASAAFAGENICMFDVGGGSTEVVRGIGGKNPDSVRSFNIGCRRVTEKFFADDPPTSAQIADARAWIMDAMGDYFAQEILPAHCSLYVAVAGTSTSVITVRDAMKHYDASRVHKARFCRAELDEVFKRMTSCTLKDREKIVGLEPARATVISAGLLILQCLMDLTRSETITVSEMDLLHGIVLAAAWELRLGDDFVQLGGAGVAR